MVVPCIPPSISRLFVGSDLSLTPSTPQRAPCSETCLTRKARNLRACSVEFCDLILCQFYCCGCGKILELLDLCRTRDGCCDGRPRDQPCQSHGCWIHVMRFGEFVQCRQNLLSLRIQERVHSPTARALVEVRRAS